MRIIESDIFPFEFISSIAERESWRKEVYRPIYHVHKWWAKRLGSVFRGIILGCILPEKDDFRDSFYKRKNFSSVSVFDPFMGSGTTVGEAHKLGCMALGRDINPVACEGVRIGLGPLSRQDIERAYSYLSATVGAKIQNLYKVEDEQGNLCDVLYYFWVKRVPCPSCTVPVDLFPSRILARNAYPKRKPEVQVCCPGCGGIFEALNTDKKVNCPSCWLSFDPHKGTANGTKATCSACSRSFAVAKTVRDSGIPPEHRLYAKLVLASDGSKRYLQADEKDRQSFEACSRQLREELEKGTIRLPKNVLADGFNTRQAIGYNYRTWRDFFNDRQLLALGWLQDAIAALPDVAVRDALLTLFSGTLEFNNLFASYKGEGTGAVRHMFSHHILKPERTPIEANVWGTPKSSGSFSNLFRGRVLRALEYRDAPFEVTLNGEGKAFDCNSPISGRLAQSWPSVTDMEPNGIYLSCGSSDETGLRDKSIDLVITDPPFFDNVQYSELADFFYAWQSLYPRGFIDDAMTTRHAREVQDTDADAFADKLGSVFRECRRVLKDDGLLVFTYHHSRTEGWESVIRAVYSAGLSVINAHPVKSEMSVATPKSQAKEPIQLDIILICKKKGQDRRKPLQPKKALEEAIRRTAKKLTRLETVGIKLSINDRRVSIISQFIAAVGPVASADDAVRALLEVEDRMYESAEIGQVSLNYDYLAAATA